MGFFVADAKSCASKALVDPESEGLFAGSANARPVMHFAKHSQNNSEPFLRLQNYPHLRGLQSVISALTAIPK
jgi:hypothetical protein